jgi:hypothetical protein
LEERRKELEEEETTASQDSLTECLARMEIRSVGCSARCDLTLIPTAVTIYGSHYFKAKFLKKSLNNINLKK